MTAAKRPPSNPTPDPADPAEAAAFLRRLVAAVADGTLEASTPQARRLVRRLELVADAFDLLTIADRDADEDTGDSD